MSAKIAESRRKAFLKALAESGNQTLSAERAKVSRSWVTLHRKRDPEFDAACREACLDFARQERERVDRDEGDGRTNSPPKGWGHLDGVQLVVRGTRGSASGRRVQIARARLHQWDAGVEERFLQVLAATCNIKAAYKAVGMTAASAYNHRKRWPAFAQRWDETVKWAHLALDGEVLGAGISLFSGEGLPEEGPFREMSVMDAIRYLHMHKHEVDGIGKAPGKRLW